MRLAITIYTNRLPTNMGGCSSGFVVRIRPKYRSDVGLHAHEYLHVKQFWSVSLLSALALFGFAQADILPLAYLPISIVVHPMMYMLIPAYRLWAEVACYREQLRHCPADRSLLFAGFIATRYKLKISVGDALKRLQGENS